MDYQIKQQISLKSSRTVQSWTTPIEYRENWGTVVRVNDRSDNPRIRKQFSVEQLWLSDYSPKLNRPSNRRRSSWLILKIFFTNSRSLRRAREGNEKHQPPATASRCPNERSGSQRLWEKHARRVEILADRPLASSPPRVRLAEDTGGVARGWQRLTLTFALTVTMPTADNADRSIAYTRKNEIYNASTPLSGELIVPME